MRPEVTLHDIDGPALRQLVEYAYTGEILITEDNVQVLLPASSLLQMEPVREACCRFLLRQLHPSNCLGIRSFAGEEMLSTPTAGRCTGRSRRSRAVSVTSPSPRSVARRPRPRPRNAITPCFHPQRPPPPAGPSAPPRPAFRPAAAWRHRPSGRAEPGWGRQCRGKEGPCLVPWGSPGALRRPLHSRRSAASYCV